MEHADLETPAAPRGAPIHQPQPPRTVTDSAVPALLAARSDWNTERTRHKFLLDAYAGTGGFQGKVRLPFRSYWGWAADVYRNDLPLADSLEIDSEAGIETYLDRFTREETPKFSRRVNMAHYPNYVSSFIDVPLSYMFRKEFQQKPDHGDAGSLGDWTEDADGAGTAWNDIVRDTIAPRAAALGWCPVLFDLPASGTMQPTAFDDERNPSLPYVVPLFPSNLLDWSHDENGTLRWAKVRTDYVDRDDPLEFGVDVTRITLWYPDRWEWFEIIVSPTSQKPTIRDMKEGTHPFGRVPIEVMRRKPIPDDPFRGIPLASSASDEARRLFNYLSELDDHMRNCAFAFLEFPTENPENAGAKLLGNGNGLPVRPDWGNTHRWVSPDPATADMYEKRIATTVEEMYRAQKMEFTRGTKGGGQRSGISQAFEFEAANRSIAEFARMVARFDQKSRRLVTGVISGAPAKESVVTKAPHSFNVEQMATELDEAMSAIALRLGPTAEAEIKKKVVRATLPHVDAETMETIEQELDELAQESATQARDLRESQQALRGNRDDIDDLVDDDEESEDQDEETDRAEEES